MRPKHGSDKHDRGNEAGGGSDEHGDILSALISSQSVLPADPSKTKTNGDLVQGWAIPAQDDSLADHGGNRRGK